MLVIGGHKSGKSSFLRSACLNCRNVLYLSTSVAADDKRIARHTKFRLPNWTVLEEPVQIGKFVVKFGNTHTIVVDDVSA